MQVRFQVLFSERERTQQKGTSSEQEDFMTKCAIGMRVECRRDCYSTDANKQNACMQECITKENKEKYKKSCTSSFLQKHNLDLEIHKQAYEWTKCKHSDFSYQDSIELWFWKCVWESLMKNIKQDVDKRKWNWP